ncbi:hypothetical protein ABI59_09380 [Acidobacteria bacterium Mor1]|nr:hypothetical protein ABI59_09380 [Acidobacteria bacterium Mor1]
MSIEREFFREVTLRICGSLEIEPALEAAFEYMRGRMPVNAIGLGFSNVEALRIETVALASDPDVEPLWEDDAGGIRLSGEGLTYVRSESGPPTLCINRPDGVPPGLLALFPGLERCSAIFTRLQLGSEVMGALLAWSNGLDRFEPEHVSLLESVREPMTIAMGNARRYRDLHRIKEKLSEDNRALSADLKRSIGNEVVGADFGLRQVMEQVRQVASASSSVLLLGETGTGKEIVANAIHAASTRNGGPMISIQCGAVPDTLLDSELFGHEKGAFTGALQRKRGRFERAHGGTLFFDEIGELSADAQVKLLRVLQERRFERVGGTEPIEVDVRVIAATHRDLDRMVREGEFREDLWYRLNVLPIRIPPLRLRREDIPSLVQYFVARKSQELSRRVTPRISNRDLERLQAYDWPGNVRELQNIVERALIVSPPDLLVFPPLRPGRSVSSRHSETTTPAIQTLDEAMAEHIRHVLQATRWRVSGPGGAAELLGMNPSTLRFRMRKLGIPAKSAGRA